MSRTTNGEEVPAEELAKIDDSRLFEEMRDTPSLYGRYADLYVEADKQSSLASVRLKALEARLLLEYKAQGGSTEAGYKAMVACDERIVEAQMEVIAHEARAKAALHRTKAIDKKLEKLRDIATRIASEFKPSPAAVANFQANSSRR